MTTSSTMGQIRGQSPSRAGRIVKSGVAGRRSATRPTAGVEGPTARGVGVLHAVERGDVVAVVREGGGDTSRDARAATREGSHSC